MIKKIINCLLCAFVLTSLTSCSVKSSKTTANTTDLRPLKVEIYGGCGVGGEYGYYELRAPLSLPNGFNIFYIDYATKTQLVLCSSSSCRHNTESCTGYIDGYGNDIYVIGEKIVLLVYTYTADGQMILNVVTADLNGENRKTIYTFNANETINSSCYTDGESIYFIANRAFKNGDAIDYQCVLVKINIYTNVATDILNLSEKYGTNSVNLFGVCKDEFVLSVNTDKTQLKSITIDGNDGKYVNDTLNYSDSDKYFDGEYEYIISYTDKEFVRKNLISGETITLDMPGDVLFAAGNSSISQIVDGIAICPCHEYKVTGNSETRTERTFAADFEENKIYELPLQCQRNGVTKTVSVVAETENQFLVINGENRVLEYYPPNNKGLISDYSTIRNYALIDKSDFWQGVPNYENIDYIG